MDIIQAAIHALYETSLATSIRESEWTFPIIQTFHILGVVIFVGGITFLDLRLLGVVLRDRHAAEVTRALLPLTWVGFVILALSGGLLFAAQSEKIYTNAFLLSKFGLIAVAGANILVFHAVTGRAIAVWGGSVGGAPALAKASAALSLLLWVGVVVVGRFIAYY